MKAIGYLVAVAALLPGLASALNPASNIPQWRYKGCYSDKRYNEYRGTTGYPSVDPANPPDGQVYGTYAYPRTLNGYFYRINPNGGALCTTTCANLGFKYAGTNDNMCFCDNAIAINGTSALGTYTYGLPDLDNTLCQFPCRGNTGEACGNNVNLASGNRLSLYELVVTNPSSSVSPIDFI
ncbi:WSC domain-containing [Pyrenophora seminiperda CCB06]|uniref:WSC domain-containing n=1 Tax=Pyrenophora seminiperda CCB06 TaxID=1302712 RepID=A0A3M7ME02_9PLEO|nr:WSC domain-containing [Pyrenophora seminiperda CCB06]